MDFFVPRVRFAMRESGILIMIHSGIDQFLRIELSTGPDGTTIIRKSQNIYDLKGAVEKVLPSAIGVHAAIILCSLLARQNTLIGVFECEVEGIDLKDEEYKERCEKIMEMHILLVVKLFAEYPFEFQFFRATKLMTSWNMTEEMQYWLSKLFIEEHLQMIERIIVSVSANSLTPLYSIDTYASSKVLGVRYGIHTMFYEYSEAAFDAFLKASVLSTGFGHFRFAQYDENAEKLWNSVELPVMIIADKMLLKMGKTKTAKGWMLVFHQKTKCGYWIYAMLESRKWAELSLDELNKFCGLGWLCKQCTDPFEYDYYQNLGRRVIREPGWTKLISSAFNTSEEEWLEKMEKARKSYEKDEKKKKDSGKSEDVTTIQKAWGFEEKQSMDSDVHEASESSESEFSASSEDEATSEFHQLYI